MHSGIPYPIDDEMLAGWKYTVCRREFKVVVSDLRVALNRWQCLVEHRAISVGLRLAPSFKCVLQNVGKIVFRLGGRGSAIR